jgi:hypothetical protein
LFRLNNPGKMNELVLDDHFYRCGIIQ